MSETRKQPCTNGDWELSDLGLLSCTQCSLYAEEHPEGDLGAAWKAQQREIRDAQQVATLDDRERVEAILPCECFKDPNHAGPCLASYRIRVLDLIGDIRGE